MKFKILSILTLVLSSFIVINLDAANVKPKVDAGTGLTKTMAPGDILVDGNGIPIGGGGGGAGTDTWARAWITLNSNTVNYVSSNSNYWNIAYNWVFSNSNYVNYIFSKTNSWNVGAAEASYASNWIAVWGPDLVTTGSLTYINSRTSYWDSVSAYVSSKSNNWDNAYSWISSNSNNVSYLVSRSNYWDSVSAYVSAKSNNWDNAYSWISANSNNVSYLVSRSNYWDSVSAYVSSKSNNWDLAYSHIATLFNGVGTTGNVTSVTGNTNQYLRGDGTWQTVIASGGGDVNSTSNNTYAVGTTQSMPNVVIDTSLNLFDNNITSLSTNTPIYADGSQPFNATLNGGGYGITNCGHLVPAASNAYDLGTAALPWRNAYYVSHTIYMGGHPISMDDDTGKLLVPGVLYSAPQYTVKSVAASDMMLRGAATDPVWDGLKARMTFDGTNALGVSFICDLPQYSPGTDIVPLILWEGNANSAADVVWQTDYIWRNIGDVSTYGDWNTLTVTNTSPAQKWKTKVCRFPSISGAGKEKNSMLQIRLQRRGDLDVNNDTASVLFFGVRYAVQSTGEDAQ
jgi:hypothetical protein